MMGGGVFNLELLRPPLSYGLLKEHILLGEGSFSLGIFPTEMMSYKFLLNFATKL